MLRRRTPDGMLAEVEGLGVVHLNEGFRSGGGVGGYEGRLKGDLLDYPFETAKAIALLVSSCCLATLYACSDV